jgi:hypothetical protein
MLGTAISRAIEFTHHAFDALAAARYALRRREALEYPRTESIVPFNSEQHHHVNSLLIQAADTPKHDRPHGCRDAADLSTVASSC